MEVDRLGDLAERVVRTDEKNAAGARIEVTASPAHQLDA
jgi:hypothetical protein